MMKQQLTFDELVNKPKAELLDMAESKLNELIGKANEPTIQANSLPVDSLSPDVSNLQVINILRKALGKLFEGLLSTLQDPNFRTIVTVEVLARFVKEDRIASSDPSFLQYNKGTIGMGQHFDLQHDPSIRILMFNILEKLLDYSSLTESSFTSIENVRELVGFLSEEVKGSTDGQATIFNILLVESNIPDSDRISILNNLHEYYAQVKSATDIELLDISVDLTSNIINAFSGAIGLIIYLYGEINQDSLKSICLSLDDSNPIKATLRKYLEG